MEKTKIAIFASGEGTNAEAIMLFFQSHPSVQVVMLLSNNAEAPALKRAARFQIPTRVFSKEQFRETEDVIHWLRQAGTTYLVLAGFLWLIPTALIRAFPDHIINIHPALLPKFSGKGMFGMNVHEAVRLANEKETGISIHLVNEKYDEGKIIFQLGCAVDETDSAKEIARKVHALEYKHFPRVIGEWIRSTSGKENN